MDAKPFAHELALLPELPLRERKVGERLLELPAPAACELLHDLVRLAEHNDEEARVALLACVALNRYEPILGYDYLSELYLVADEKGYLDVKRLLTTREARKKAPKDGVENEYVEKTLGERKELARVTRNRDVLDRLLYDRNPAVIRAVLANPRLVEADVVKIGAMRPTQPAILEEILRSARWASRYRIKLTLAQNPYLPTNNAVSLLPFLLTQDLRAIHQSLELSDAVREAARSLLARRAHEEGSGSGAPPS